jgi:hypothetical protein
MATDTANSSKGWASLSVRKSTEEAVDRLRSDFMRLHGAFISDDDVVTFALKGVKAKDLPAPDKKVTAGK